MKVIARTEDLLLEKKHIGIFLLRLFIGLRLLYGVLDNIFIWDRMIEFSHFLSKNNIPFPLFSAIVSVYVQFFGGLCILIGYRTRLASFILTLNFIVAVYVHINLNDTIEGMTPALAILFSCITFLFTGAEKLSVDHWLRKNK